MIRLTGRGSPAEDTKKVRPAAPVNGVCPPGLSQSKPLTPRAERRAIGGSWCYQSHAHYTHRAWGHGLADKPGVPRALGFKGKMRRLEYGRTRAG